MYNIQNKSQALPPTSSAPGSTTIPPGLRVTAAPVSLTTVVLEVLGVLAVLLVLVVLGVLGVLVVLLVLVVLKVLVVFVVFVVFVLFVGRSIFGTNTPPKISVAEVPRTEPLA